MAFDDPNAERFSQEVAQNAEKYYHETLEGPVNTMTGALRRIWQITGDPKYDRAAGRIEDVFSTLPQEAAMRAGEVYSAYQEMAADPNAEPPGPESALDPGAMKVVNEGWQTAASLSHVNDERAVAAQAIVRRMALQLQSLLDERSGADAFDAAVLDPAAQKHLL